MINIADILKHCKKGIVLYSSDLGDCVFISVLDKSRHGKDVILVDAPINSDIGTYRYYTAYGTRILDESTPDPDNVIRLFPSQNMRDWSRVQPVDGRLRLI